MAATFTTWAALEAEIKNDLATGSWRMKSYTVDGQSTTFRDVDEILKFYSFVSSQAAQDARAFSGRTYAKNGGRAS